MRLCIDFIGQSDTTWVTTDKTRPSVLWARLPIHAEYRRHSFHHSRRTFVSTLSKPWWSAVHMTTRLHVDHDRWSENDKIGLQSFSACHDAMLQTWLIAQLQEVINQSSWTSHAHAERLASAGSYVLWNKPINYLAVSMWSFWIRRKFVGLPQMPLDSRVVWKAISAPHMGKTRTA